MEYQIEQNQQISAKVFGAKFRSKIECLRFLTIECGAYLPNHKVITLYFIKSLLSGEKRVSKN